MKLSTTPAQDGFYFPAEFQPVSEVWLAWPERKDNWRDDALPAQETFARIANLIAEVTKVCVAVCSHNFDRARQMLQLSGDDELSKGMTMQQIQNQSLVSFMVANPQQGIAVTNPATGELLGYAPVSTENDILNSIERAHVAQKEWAALPAKTRAGMLNRWFQLLLENKADLGRLMTLEQGKPLAEAQGEVLYGASFIEWFAEEAKRTYGETIPAPSADKRLVTIKQPIGVACAITPWNFPIAMITRKAGPALAAGCSFVVKPSESTPLSAFAVAELAYQAGVPRDVLQVVLGENSRQVGAIFTSHPLIRKLSFTGSTYGLASYFYSQNIHRVWKIAEALEYGMVGINEGMISTEVAPFGGVKQSGIGREGAKQGIDEYMDVKYLCFGGN